MPDHSSSVKKEESKSKRSTKKAASREDADRLLAEARAGTPEAIEKLFELLSAAIWTDFRAQRRRDGMEPARTQSDLIQDTLTRARQEFSDFHGESFDTFKRWAYAIFHRLWLYWARDFDVSKKHKEQIGRFIRFRLSGARPSEDGHPPIEVKEQADQAWRTFQRLRKEERHIIQLRLLNGLKYKEIAAMTGMSESALGHAYRRAMARLRKLFHSNDQS